MITTGYFADTKNSTKVHLVENGKPICGVAIGIKKQYQWCARRVHLEYLECKRCKNKQAGGEVATRWVLAPLFAGSNPARSAKYGTVAPNGRAQG